MATKPPGALRRTISTLFKIGVYGTALALIALGVAVGIAMSRLPDYQQLVRRGDLGQTIRVRAADGSVIVALGPSFGDWLGYEQIPQIMVDAMVAVEDRRFRYHPGVDPVGIVRGIQVSATEGGRVRGVSTITQQLARNIFLTNKRSYGRKMQEAILALAIEGRFSKDQILELYLNRVYFGGGAYGIDAASRRFFGHSADSLNLSEAAIIAGLVKAPSNYSPTADAEAARDRAGVVIDLMRRNGDISAAEAASAEPAEVKLVPTPRQNSVRYFTDWVLPQLDTLIDEAVEPIDVWTTLDLEMQRAGDRAINANTPRGAQGALVSLDRDGAIRAMVGGRDYVDSLYNRATQAQRQPGSAFKLFVYLSALEAGYTPTSTVVDSPVTINGWTPRNNSRNYSGQVTIRDAFAYSLNTISAKLGQEVGFRTVADMAQRMGITTPVNTHPSMVLGTSDVRLIDMTRAFASVAQRGVAVVPYGIRRVTRTNGELLYQHQPNQSRVLVAPWVAAQMTDLLQSAVLVGTGRAANIGRPVAGKTGTTSSNKDGWFIGFSSGLTTGVWMGRDDAKPLPGLQGGTSPARAFQNFMSKAVAKRPVENFETDVTPPDWQIEGSEGGGMTEEYLTNPDGSAVLGPDGQPLQRIPEISPEEREAIEGGSQTERLDQEWLEDTVRRPPPPQREAPPPRVLPPLPQQRTPQSTPPEDVEGF